jgi:DNA-binding CsgD family transcriptional regulator
MSPSANATFIEFVKSTHSESSLETGEFLEDVNRFSGFADQLDSMLFVMDLPTGSYPFLNKGSIYTLGFDKAALKEGGIEFIDSRIKVPLEINRKVMAEQMKVFQQIKELPPNNISVSMLYPVLDNENKPRNIFQQFKILKKSEEGFPLGYVGSGTWLQGVEPSKIYQQVDILDTEANCWSTFSYVEFHPGIEDNKLLSRREIEILKYLADGLSSKQIAGKLYLSTYTIDTHRKNMLRRTNTSNVAELLHYAMAAGILS